MDACLEKPVDPRRLEVLLGSSGSIHQPRSSDHACNQSSAARPSTFTNDFPLSIERVLKRFESEHELIEEVLSMVQSSVEDDLGQLLNSIRIGDIRSAAMWSHRLKSAAGMVSADALATLAAAIEEASRLGDFATASAVSDALSREAARVLQCLPEARRSLARE